MFVARTIRTSLDWQDLDGTKLYTISLDDHTVDQSLFLARMVEVKASRSIPWSVVHSLLAAVDCAFWDKVPLLHRVLAHLQEKLRTTTMAANPLIS